MKRMLGILAALLLLTTAACAAELPALPDGALPEGLSEAAEREGVLSGGLSWLTSSAREAALGALRAGTRSAAQLVLVSLLCGAAAGLAESAGETAAQYVPFCGVAAAAVLSAGDWSALIGLGVRTAEELGTLAKLLLPTLAAAMASGGLASAASVWQVTTLLVSDALCTAVARLLLPLAYGCIALSAAGAMLGEERLGALSDGIGRFTAALLKLAAGAFAGYLTLAGVLTGSADRAEIRAVKAAVSGAIPVVGGVLADTAESALTAAGALRGVIGALGVFAILAVCLAPLLRLGAQYLLYQLAAFAAGLAGTKPLADFLDRLGRVFALVFAMTAACALILLTAMLVAVTVAAG